MIAGPDEDDGTKKNRGLEGTGESHVFARQALVSCWCV